MAKRKVLGPPKFGTKAAVRRCLGVSRERVVELIDLGYVEIVPGTPVPAIGRRDLNEEQIRRDRAFEKNIFKAYGLTPEVYRAIYAAQGGRCGICGTPEPDRRYYHRLSIDHDHVTGKVRGLLCARCNTGLGQMGDSLMNARAAVAYLEREDPTLPYTPCGSGAISPQLSQSSSEPPANTMI